MCLPQCRVVSLSGRSLKGAWVTGPHPKWAISRTGGIENESLESRDDRSPTSRRHCAPLNESKQENGERVSRQQAAEQLTDVAYALMTGGELRLKGDRQVTVPIADEVVLKRNDSANGDRVALELELSWSTAKPAT